MDIKLICTKANKNGEFETFDITETVSEVKWSGDINACARMLEMSCLKTIDIPLSSMIIFFEGEKELFRGFVFERDKSSTSGLVNYICYDHAERLNKIKASYNIKNKKADEVLRMLLKDYGLKENIDIAGDHNRFSKIFIGETLYDIIQSAYTYQSRINGRKYMIFSKKDTIGSMVKGVTKLQVKFEEGKNIIDSNFKESISSMVNKVIIVDANGNKSSEVKDEAMMKIHGLFQDVYKVEEGKDASIVAKSMLKGVEKTCSLSGFGDTTCMTGFGVEVLDTDTGLTGLFYIDADTHTWTNGKYLIDLTLNFQNIMHEVDGGEDESKDNSNSVTTVTGGKEVNAEFTAYFPDASAMEGGFIDAMGNKLNPNKLTCACPKEVAFNTKIQVKGTGTGKDNLVYKCNDRGSRIKIKPDGTYCIDLLVATRSEAKAFGRRKGKAIIGVKETSTNNLGSNAAESDKLLNELKKHLGKPYVWGAVGPNTFDCSGLTSYVYKHALGITIPRNSSAQASGGKSISKNNVLPGDILHFPGHVGMYAGNGQMIHAPNPKEPVKYDKCFEGYYGGRLDTIRRYW